MFFSNQSRSFPLLSLIQYGLMLAITLQLFYELASASKLDENADALIKAGTEFKDTSGWDIVSHCLKAVWKCNFNSTNLMGVNRNSIAFHNMTNPEFAGNWQDCVDHSLKNSPDVRDMLKAFMQIFAPNEDISELNVLPEDEWQCYSPNTCNLK